MKLTHIDEAPCLEHNGEVIFLAQEQYNALSKMNAEQAKAFLRRDVMQTLSTNPQATLARWLADSSIDWHLQID